MISDSPVALPSNEIRIVGRISFISQYPYMTDVHRVRILIDNYISLSIIMAFVGIVSEESRIENTENAKDFN